MNKQPLWMPRGSVRAILAIALVVAFIVAVFVLNVEKIAVLSPVALIVIKDYFEGRGKSDPGVAKTGEDTI